MTRTAPDTMSTALSLRSAKKAIVWLSGDQNGFDAPSVPSRGRATGDSSDLNQSDVEPWGSLATNARCWPLGEIASIPPDAGNWRVSGWGIVNWTGLRGGSLTERRSNANPRR